MSIKMIFGIIVALVLIMIIFSIPGARNTANSLEQNVLRSKSDISVEEKRMADLIKRMVSSIREQEKFEHDTLVDVVEKRLNSGDVSGADIAIHAVMEAYPQLGTNNSFSQLNNELAVSENKKESSRTAYNSNVEDYYTYVNSFPATLYLPISGYRVREFLYLDYTGQADLPEDIFAK